MIRVLAVVGLLVLALTLSFGDVEGVGARSNLVSVSDLSENNPRFFRKPFYLKAPVKQPIDLTNYATVLVDTTKQLSHEQILASLGNIDAIPLSSFAFEEKYTRGKYAYWVLYSITNELDTPIEIGIDIGVFDSIQTYVYVDDSLVQRSLSGNRVNPTDHDSATQIATYFRTQLAPATSYHYLSRITNEIEINRAIKPTIVNPPSHANRVLSRFVTIYSLQSAFLAILFIVMVINFFQFLLNKEKAFLFYSLYILLVLAFFSRDFYCTSPIILFGVGAVCKNTYLSPLMIGNFVMYALFVIAFLETKQKEPVLHRALIIGIRICLVYLLIERIVDVWNPYLAWKLYGYFKIVILGATLVLVFLVAKMKNPLSFFILSGTLALLLATITTAVLSFRSVHFVNYLDTTYIPQYVGILVELFLFSIGLGYKTKLTEYERRKAKSELALKELEITHEKELWSVRSHFYTQVTHEFRTPLTVILGMADAIQSQTKNARVDGIAQSLEMIQRNGKNLLRLVNEMLDLAKTESGTMKLRLFQADIVPFVKYLCESFQSLASESQIELAVYSEIDTLVMDFDNDKVQAIISNLLSNAIKFTAPGGEIIVHLNQIEKGEQEYFFIKVKDNGEGISAEALPHFFDRFYQVDSSSSRPGEGTGIGLALTKELVELMGGTVTVSSQVGQGSEFAVRLSVTRNASEAKETHLPERPQPVLTPDDEFLINTAPPTDGLPLALIIEDNADVAHYLKTCLTGRYRTLRATEGTSGLEMAYEHIPDIVICDVMMPGKDGYEVCATLKADERTDHVPVIMLTAKVTHQDRLTGLAHGADAYLTKPFSQAELFTRLDQLVLLRKKMLSKLVRDGYHTFSNTQPENPETKFIQKAVQIIDENISNHDFGSQQLAQQLHLSESQIYRKLKAITGKSTAIFIRSVRLQQAKDLIQTTNKPISEVAYEVGFNDPSWFSRAFKEEFGQAPSAVAK